MEMATETESHCCSEIGEISSKIEQYNKEGTTTNHVTCITDHPGFRTVCLDRYVLETAYFQYRQQYGDVAVGSENE